jgi:hypothetical protein
MISHTKTLLFATALLATMVLSISAQRGGPPPVFSNERFVVRAMADLHAAQATYSSTTGAGNYATLSQLRTAGLIDEALASGAKYGYLFTVTPKQSTYTANALPLRYRKTGRHSYHIDQEGVLVSGDRMGQPVSRIEGVYVDTCALYGLDQNERCTISAMRTLHGAQVTYAATVGNGQFADVLSDLYVARLIDIVLALGTKHGYDFEMKAVSGSPGTFKIWAQPTQHGVTGRRSFYVDQTGVVRGADRGGSPSGPNDPPVN